MQVPWEALVCQVPQVIDIQLFFLLTCSYEPRWAIFIVCMLLCCYNVHMFSAKHGSNCWYVMLKQALLEIQAPRVQLVTVLGLDSTGWTTDDMWTLQERVGSPEFTKASTCNAHILDCCRMYRC